MDPLIELALSVKAAQREMERLITEAVRPLGLTAGQADALIVLRRAGTLSLKELGDLLIAESGHPSRLVDRLVEAGLVERRAAAGDRRRVELSLTTAGRRMERRAQRAREQVITTARALIGERDTTPVLTFLRELLAQTPSGEVVARRRELESS